MIKYIIYSSYFLVLAITFTACNKEGAGCFDKAGNLTTVPIDVPNFNSIDIATNVDVKLVNDGVNRVELTIGENLIRGIKFEVTEGVLKIKNLNTCFWSNGYTHPLVTIYNSNFTSIIQHGYGNIYSLDTLMVDQLRLQVEDASGGINLLLKANLVHVVSNNIGPITLSGNANTLNATHAYNNGILYAKNLTVAIANITHNGSNRMELNVKEKLIGKMTSFGNIYLYGQRPIEFIIEDTGEGAVIEMF